MYKSILKSVFMVLVLSLVFSSSPSFCADKAEAASSRAKVTGSSIVFTLMEKKVASVNDLIDTLLIFKNISIEKLSLDEKVKILRDAKVIGGRVKINGEGLLNKGFAALLFHGALNLRGGLTLRLTGRSQRNCLQDMIYLKIMPDSSAKDKMSGPELVSLLQRAKEFNLAKAGIAEEPQAASEVVQEKVEKIETRK
ncbi:MAG: hypothetical protein ACD_47C00060G0003 [uncultured bacterium]|uniref:Uncharacterized protein n=1 Tax=Candidatus Wallbacteria bacterium GWC2_49_35 TaxID=1817813 RepID=A0A1F7WK13_9BACT|nr:MAG: hypothetical protein ACD_47C00060G0003 [uncultured bacterium]OGM02759.1 MAG: hypothetical protein A2008_04070 [Candidatus Wallbacteria bacterium GWC2_49_35]HBC76300.1 hypothetical protein [Candidatus Wallbacteria bacterium]